MHKSNLIVLWFYQLGVRLSVFFILCLCLTPLFAYLHFNIPDPDEAVTLTQYFFGLMYRGGFFFIFLFIADACRYVFQDND